MSSDNGIVITKTEGGFEVYEWFGEGENYSPLGTFPTIEEAIVCGQSVYTEYGLSFELGSPTDSKEAE